jgi:hypothetical protein
MKPATLMALLLTLAPASALAQTLVRDGRPVARIYFAPSDSLETAAEELNYHLGKMSGATLQVVRTSDPGAVKGPAVVLGSLAVKMGAAPKEVTPSREGFRLLTKGQTLLIGGESDTAALFGAYAVLETLGVDWVMPGKIGEVIPRRTTVIVAPLDESQRPDFSMRRLWYRGGADTVTREDKTRMAVWLRRQRAGAFQPLSAQTAGHYWPTFIKRHKAAFDADPTLYALRRGADGQLVRRGPQLETTDPRIAAMMAQDIRDTFETKGWPRDKAVGFPIGPADTAGYSVSPESLAAGSSALDPITGEPDQTDLLVKLANDVLAALGPAYPNVHLGFYSYGSHQGYPGRYTPDPRVAVIFAPINFSRYHALTDGTSRSQPLYRTVFDQWATLARRQGNPMLYRGYNWNLAENMLPYSKLAIWGEELAYYRDAGVEGLNIEATKAWGVNGPSDWLFMQLAWDASQDWRTLLDDYCAKAFGDGAEPMRRYLLRLTETQRAAGQEAGSYHAIPLIFDQAFVAAAQADISEAERLARLPAEKERIAYFRSGVDLLDLYLAYHAAANRFDFKTALERYYAMHTAWGFYHARNPDIVAREAPVYLERFIGPFVREAARHQVLQPLPDRLKTAFGDGDYQDPAFDDSAWPLTSTFASTWDAQRLAGRTVWYRHRFTLTEAEAGGSINLFLGGFDDRATVWLNGRRIGDSGRRFSVPVIFALPGATAGENLLAIEIVRDHPVNEIGVGGLIRPSFLFSR